MKVNETTILMKDGKHYVQFSHHINNNKFYIYALNQAYAPPLDYTRTIRYINWRNRRYLYFD